MRAARSISSGIDSGFGAMDVVLGCDCLGRAKKDVGAAAPKVVGGGLCKAWQLGG
jgi:hypothetical protein